MTAGYPAVAIVQFCFFLTLSSCLVDSWHPVPGLLCFSKSGLVDCLSVPGHRLQLSHCGFAGGASAIIATADEEAVQKACKEAANENTDFVWTQLRALGSFLGIRAQHKKQQYALQQQPQQQPQQQQPTSPNHGMSQAAAGPDGKGTSEQPDKGNAIPARRQQSQAMAQDVQRAVNGAMANGKNAQHNSSACGGDANPADPANADAKSAPSTLEQNGRASHEQAASTTEEHTEEHKYVKTEQDEAGNQQAKAEVVQKSTTTQVKKRKRVEQSSAGRDGNGNAVQAGASPSDPNQAMPDASGQASPGQASKVGEQQLANGNGKVLEDQKPSPGREHSFCCAIMSDPLCEHFPSASCLRRLDFCSAVSANF